MRRSTIYTIAAGEDYSLYPLASESHFTSLRAALLSHGVPAVSGSNFDPDEHPATPAMTRVILPTRGVPWQCVWVAETSMRPIKPPAPTSTDT